jgi:hypothetical protein
MPFKALNHLIINKILVNPVQHTNQYTLIIQPKFSHEREDTCTGKTEITADNGLPYLAGALQTNKQSIEIVRC